METILVTNYKEGFFSIPINKIMPNKRIIFNKNDMEIIINESVSVGVFEKIPYMRNIPSNNSWFKNNIYHLR
jgi:hypothetical protein